MAQKTIFESAHKGDFETVSKKLEEDPSLLTAKDSVSSFSIYLLPFKHFNTISESETTYPLGGSWRQHQTSLTFD